MSGQRVVTSLEDLIASARRRGQWLWCPSQDVYFHPDDLTAENRRGKFRWGPMSWHLVDPLALVAKYERLASEHRERAASIERRIAKG